MSRVKDKGHGRQKTGERKEIRGQWDKWSAPLPHEGDGGDGAEVLPRIAWRLVRGRHHHAWSTKGPPPGPAECREIGFVRCRFSPLSHLALWPYGWGVIISVGTPSVSGSNTSSPHLALGLSQTSPGRGVIPPYRTGQNFESSHSSCLRAWASSQGTPGSIVPSGKRQSKPPTRPSALSPPTARAGDHTLGRRSWDLPRRSGQRR